MKAAIFHGVGKALAIEEIAIPEPQQHEVVLKVGRCGICSSDVAMTSGQGWTYAAGLSLGHEYAGEVVALGPGVERLRIGDRITAMPMSGCGRCASCLAGRPMSCANGMRMMMGGYGEFTLADERFAIRLPASLSLADGALVEPLAAALHGVAMAPLRCGESVVVLGAGPIGVGAIYWARRLGAGRVVASARSSRRAGLAFAMGATAFLKVEDLPAALPDTLRGLPDIVLECTGAPGVLAQAIDLVRPGGTIVCLGVCSLADSFVPATASYKEVCVRFACAYNLADFRFAVDTLDRGAVEPRAMVETTVGLNAVPELLEDMRAGHSHGAKILVAPHGAPPFAQGEDHG